jgi:MFS superfamily sulfate permease-like transporter
VTQRCQIIQQAFIQSFSVGKGAIWHGASSTFFSLTLACALRESLSDGCGQQDFGKDILVGVTVGVIAIPLVMACAVGTRLGGAYLIILPVVDRKILRF